MSTHHFFSITTLSLAAWTLSMNESHAFKPAENQDAYSAAESAQHAHNIESWWGKEVVKADVEIVFGGKAIVDGTFTFEAHGPRARYDRADGTKIIFDGNTAWISPASIEAPMGRFHVLTWPWFIMAPFKMAGDGIQLSELKQTKIGKHNYISIYQTFGENVGDTPDDWYRFFIDPKTSQIDAMSYIVTYGKDTEEANKQPSIIRYFDYTDAGGPRISTRYELWYWDPETNTFLGDSPKGTGTVSNIEYLKAADVDFEVPAGARELALP